MKDIRKGKYSLKNTVAQKKLETYGKLIQQNCIIEKKNKNRLNRVDKMKENL